MNNIQKRFLLFLFLCIGARSTLTILSAKIEKKYLPILGIITLPISIEFLRIYIFGSDKADAQIDWVQGNVWWNDLRIVHGLLYLSFTIASFFAINEKYRKNNKSWVILLSDTIIGLVSFLHYHYKSGNFKYLF